MMRLDSVVIWSLLLLLLTAGEAQTVSLPPENPPVPGEAPLVVDAEAELSSPMSYDQLLQLARTRNPEWAAALAGPRAAEGELLQAGMTPNPVVQASTDIELPFRVERAGLSLSQEIELGGKRRARIAAATARLEAARYRALEVERTLRLQLRTAYVDILYAQLLQTLRTDALRLSERALELGRGRLKAGDVAGVDVMQLEVDTARRRAELEEATGQLLSARTVMTRLFGVPLGSDFRLVEEGWAVLDAIPELANLQGVASQRPDLLRAIAEADAAEKEITVQRTAGISNLTASVGLGRERPFIDGDAFNPPGIIDSVRESNWALSLSLSIPIPINDTNEGNIRKAQAEAEGARLTSAAARQIVETEVAQAYTELQAALRSLQPLEETALERARQVQEITEQAYRLGERSLFEVLQSRQQYLELRQARIDAQRSLELARARLEAAIGNPIGGPIP